MALKIFLWYTTWIVFSNNKTLPWVPENIFFARDGEQDFTSLRSGSWMLPVPLQWLGLGSALAKKWALCSWSHVSKFFLKKIYKECQKRKEHNYNGCLCIFFHRIREKQLRESYILKYGDKVEGMKLNQVQIKVWLIGDTKNHVQVIASPYKVYKYPGLVSQNLLQRLVKKTFLSCVWWLWWHQINSQFTSNGRNVTHICFQLCIPRSWLGHINQGNGNSSYQTRNSLCSS